MAAVLGEMVKVIFNHHCYEFDGRLYHQQKGGPTGLRPSGPCSRIILDFWRKVIAEISETQNTLATLKPEVFPRFDIYLLKKYVDDLCSITEAFPKGTVWNPVNRAFMLDKNLKTEDKREDADRTLEEISKMASGVLKCLNFTWDTPNQNKNKKMPVLDTQLWVEIPKKGKGIPKFIEGDHQECAMPEIPKPIVMYCFFKKPMASTRNNMNRGGLPISSKVATTVN